MNPVIITFMAVGITFWACSGLIVCHHKCKHSNPDDVQHVQPPGEQWFQRKDVCVACCTHENWAVAFITLGMAFVCSAIILYVSS